MSTIILPSSVTQTQAHEKTSLRYQFVNTGLLVEKLKTNGLVVRKAQQTNSKKYAGFQKHLVRMSMPNIKVGDTFPEILIINSHTGTGSLQFRLGLYRVACSNGLIVGSEIGKVTVRHFGDNVQKIVEDALNDLHTQLPMVAQTIEMMRSRKMTDQEMAAFAQKALEVRGVPAKLAKQPDIMSILTDRVLVARREEDAESNLWEVFNKTQENLVRGTDGLRAIRGMNRDLDLNKELWNVAESFLAA